MKMRISQQQKLGSFGLLASLAIAFASLASGRDATADLATNVASTQKIYGNIPPDQAEHISTVDRIKSAAAGGSMMAIWETLEHGEKVECLECVPAIAELMYDANPRTREIAAWWLRRRVFGVFGPGQIYEQTIVNLKTKEDPVLRAYAAEALGEFLAAPGVDAVATAAVQDSAPVVRAAAVKALGRLNDDGKGAIGKAFLDGDKNVRLAAIQSAGRINTFADASGLVRLTRDPDVVVRRNAAELLGNVKSAESVDGLIALTADPDANVRNAAAHALGALRDPKARPALEALANGDPNGLVRDQAQIALRRL
jgi:HEAT repeat protein